MNILCMSGSLIINKLNVNVVLPAVLPLSEGRNLRVKHWNLESKESE